MGCLTVNGDALNVRVLLQGWASCTTMVGHTRAHLDLREGLPNGGQLDADVVGAAVLHQADLLSAAYGQLPQCAVLHDLEESFQLIVVDGRLILQAGWHMERGKHMGALMSCLVVEGGGGSTPLVNYRALP